MSEPAKDVNERTASQLNRKVISLTARIIFFAAGIGQRKAEKGGMKVSFRVISGDKVTVTRKT